VSRRQLLIGALLVSVAALSFSLGASYTQRRIERQLAANDARIAELGIQMVRGDEIKEQIQNEMGLMPIRVLRERRTSFVEVHAYDQFGNLHYSTAGHLGDGYFITVKHGVMALDEGEGARQITSVAILYKGEPVPVQVVDSGAATTEVHPGDWAIIRAEREIDLPALRTDTDYAYDFADPIFRLGNDYSKGIILSTGYIGQRMPNGLVTSLTDGHPGVSGGGVLNQRGDLVGIPIGRMDGDYRFSFILPLRNEMFDEVPPSVVKAGRGPLLTN
jgi:hypothetical protein